MVNYDFSSVQFNMPQALAKEVIAWGKKNIDDDDLYTAEKKYGREDEIHVTVKYGLHTSDVRKVRKIIDGFGDFEISLGNISRFCKKEKEYDVIKMDIESEKLSELHKMLGELDNSDEHPVYRPHCTIAYVKKGKCSNLSGNTDLSGKAVKVNTLVFSSHTGEKTKINLS